MGNKINYLPKMFSTTITASGQATIPKEVRNLINVDVGERLIFYVGPDNRVYIDRPLTDEEFCAKIDAMETPKSKALAKKYAGMTVSEMRSAWEHSPEGQAYLKEKYGI